LGRFGGGRGGHDNVSSSVKCGLFTYYRKKSQGKYAVGLPVCSVWIACRAGFC
jgi:hypothetical protein